MFYDKNIKAVFYVLKGAPRCKVKEIEKNILQIVPNIYIFDENEQIQILYVMTKEFPNHDIQFLNEV